MYIFWFEYDTIKDRFEPKSYGQFLRKPISIKPI